MNLPDVTDGVNKVIPKFYEDAIQPGAKVVGQMGETLAKTINTALLPLRLIVWKAEEIETSIKTGLEKKMENIPLEDIQTPNPRIAGPTLEGLRYTAQEKELREMYTSLLANSMNKKVANDVHPSFPEIIKQLQPDEAKILEYLSYAESIAKIDVRSKPREIKGYNIVLKNYSVISRLGNIENSFKINTYIDNLVRLSLIEIEHGVYFTSEKLYEGLINSNTIEKLKNQIEKEGKNFEINKGIIKLTEFGQDFCNCCIEKKKNGISFTLKID